MSEIHVLDKTVCIHLSATLWSGRRQLRADDLGSEAGKLPPEDLASLGSLKLCDPEKITRLNSIKRAAERDCEKVCMRFLGGYATEQGNVAELDQQLAKRKAAFQAQAKCFVDSLHTDIEDWIVKHPQWEHLIRKALPDPAYVSGRFNFEYRIFKVGTAVDDDDAGLNDGLIAATNGLSDQLFLEIEAEAKTIWKRTFEGRDIVTQKALRPIRAIVTKLEALQFIDKRTLPIIERITSVLESMPKAGKIEGNNLSALIGLLHLLSDAQHMKDHGESVLKLKQNSLDDTESSLDSCIDCTNETFIDTQVNNEDLVDLNSEDKSSGSISNAEPQKILPAKPEKTSDAVWL